MHANSKALQIAIMLGTSWPSPPQNFLLTWDSMRLLWNGNKAESTSHSRSLSSDCADASNIVPARGGREEGKRIGLVFNKRKRFS